MDRPNYITPQGYAALKARYDQLLGVERPAIVEIVSWAAGNGDRSENGDYLYGRKRMREIDRELGRLARKMKAARVIDPATQADKSRIWFGAEVDIADEDDNWRTLTLVGDDEQDAGAGRIGWSSPLARALKERAEQLGLQVTLTREPGGSPKAEAIREVILSGAVKEHGPFVEALMFSAARIDHIDRLIRPALARGNWVLCDRFIDSTRAYQGAAGGLDAETLAALERVVVGATRPDLTLILDLAPEIGLSRARQRDRAASRGPDRFEAEALGFHQRLRAAFLAIAAAEPARCAVIDAQGSPEAVAQAVRATVATRLPHLVGGASDAA